MWDLVSFSSSVLHIVCFLVYPDEDLYGVAASKAIFTLNSTATPVVMDESFDYAGIESVEELKFPEI